MKNVFKLFGLIALVAVIGFSFAACGGDDDGGGNDNGGSNNGGNGNGATVTSISITSFPTKTTYVVGDKLDTSGLVVKAYYSDGTNQDVTTYTTDFDSSTTGTKTVTVSYGGKTATRTFTVTVYGKGTSGTCNSIYDFEMWLTTQPDNTATSPHNVKLNVNSLEGGLGGSFTAGSVGYIIKANANKKYLSLDLSGSSLTSIGNGAFSGCTNLTSVIIPNSVTSIENAAFGYCTNLTSLIIPNSVTSIKSYAFSHCTSLASITIPDGVTSIGYEAFSDCTGLTSVIIPNKVTSIEYGTFAGCTGLTSVTIPAGVTSIGDEAFSGCSSLANVTIPAAVTHIGYRAFRNCTSFTSVTFQGVISSSEFHFLAFEGCGNLHSKYFEANGGIGTYVRAPGGSAWTKQ